MKTLAVGDEVFFGSVPGYGGHGATCIVTKINRKSIKATERPGSYKPGIQWIFGTSLELCRQTIKNETAPYVTMEWFRLGDNGEML